MSNHHRIHEQRIFELIEKMGPMGLMALQKAEGLAEAKRNRARVTLEHIAEFFEILVEQSEERAADERATEAKLGSIESDLRGFAGIVRRVLIYAGVPVAKLGGAR